MIQPLAETQADHLQPPIHGVEKDCFAERLDEAPVHDWTSTDQEYWNSFLDNICHGGSLCCRYSVQQDTLRSLLCSKILTARVLSVI